jgi:O-antigen ligase
MASRLTEKLLVFIVFCAVPFLGGNNLSIYYAHIDRFWIENVFLLSCIFLLIIIAGKGRPALLLFGKNYFFFFAPFLVVNVISLIYTWNTLSTLKEINLLVWTVGAVFIMQMLTDRDSILKALVVGAFLSSLCLIIQLTILYPRLSEIAASGKYFYIMQGQQIPTSSFIHYNVLGGYFASVLPLSIYFVIFDKKHFYTLTTIFILTGLIITTTRVGMGLAFLTVLMTGILLAKDRNIKGLFMLLGLLVAGIALSVLLMNWGGKGGITGVQNELANKMENIVSHMETLNTRTEIWKNGFKAFIEKPALGYGAGTFEYPYKKYYGGRFATKYAHNTVVKVAVELGIVGLICWFLFLVGLFLWTKKVFSGRRNIYVACSTLSLLAYGLLDFSFNIPAHVITFFVLAAMLQGYREERDPNSCLDDTAKMSRYVLFLPAILILTASFYFTIMASSADRAIASGDSLAEHGLLLNASRSYEEALKRMPLNNMAYIKASQAMGVLYSHAKDDEKKKLFESDLLHYLSKMEGIKDRNAELFSALGTGYAKLGHRKKADLYLNRAVSYLPSSSFFVLTLANYYFDLGEYQKAVGAIHSFAPYVANYEMSRDPNGLFVYKMRDLEVEMELRKGNNEKALNLARQNLADAESERFVIRSMQAVQLVESKPVVEHLRKRVEMIKPGFETGPKSVNR